MSWRTLDGNYGCFDYAAKEWCENGGLGREWNYSWKWKPGTNGLPASSACCVCGGKGISGNHLGIKDLQYRMSLGYSVNMICFELTQSQILGARKEKNKHMLEKSMKKLMDENKELSEQIHILQTAIDTKEEKIQKNLVANSKKLEKNSETLNTIGHEVHLLKENIDEVDLKGKNQFSKRLNNVELFLL